MSVSNDLHNCAIPGCPNQCCRSYLMCFRHWSQVPRHTKAAVLATYDPDGTPTREYVSAVRAAIEAVASAEHPPAETPAPAPHPTPQTNKPTLSLECVEAARCASRVLVSEGLMAEYHAKARLWSFIEGEMRREIQGDFTLDQITPQIIEAAARDLRKHLIENARLSASIAEQEQIMRDFEAVQPRRAHATCRSCGAHVRWEKHPYTNKPHPVNLDSTSHFSTCPQAKNWRSKK